MKDVFSFLASVIGTNQLGIGEVRAQGLAALVIAAGFLLVLFYRDGP